MLNFTGTSVHVYLVTVSLADPDASLPGVQEALRRCRAMTLTPTTFAVATAGGARQLFARIEPAFGPDDKVYIVRAVAPYWGQGDEDVWDWLNANV